MSPDPVSTDPEQAAPETGPADAVDVLVDENRAIAELLEDWRAAGRRLEEGDDIDTRWNRGSAAKLLVQHIAAREAAKEVIAGRLDEAGAADLAGRVRGDADHRRQLLRELDELGRGHQAMTLNTPAVNEAVAAFGEVFDAEQPAEADLPSAVHAALDASPDTDLPSARRVYSETTLRPPLEPHWYDRIRVLRVIRAHYQSLRFAPRGGTMPGVDPAREHDHDRS